MSRLTDQITDLLIAHRSNGFQLDFSVGNLCYTEYMHEDRSFWPSWASTLKKKGVKDLAVLLLEGAGPLRILASQALYAGIPFLNHSSHIQSWKALADLLDDPEESQSFISFLREEV